VHGFAPLDTPALEYSEVLLGKYGDEGDKLLFRFRDHGDRDVALRYDLTVPLARVVAMNAQLPLPFKRYQIASVWRAEKPGRGRFREFAQCDADIIGAEGAPAEVEILALGQAILKALGVSSFTLRVNHRGVFDALLDLMGVKGHDERAAVVRTIDKIEKIGREAVLRVLDEAGLSKGARATLGSFLDIPAGDLDAARELFGESGAGAIDSLSATMELARDAGHGEHLAVDLSIARGLDYYTGLIYETVLGDLPAVGSVMSGGRYDGLMSMFGAPPHPAVGISLGVDRLYAALVELGRTAQRATPTQVLVACFGEDGFGGAWSICEQLRSAGICAEVFLRPTVKLGKQLRYADRMGIPLVAIQGPDEREAGIVKLRDLRSGDELETPASEIAARARVRLDS
jgi:histidyl-tRNA synthetase